MKVLSKTFCSNDHVGGPAHHVTLHDTTPKCDTTRSQSEIEIQIYIHILTHTSSHTHTHSWAGGKSEWPRLSSARWADTHFLSQYRQAAIDHFKGKEPNLGEIGLNLLSLISGECRSIACLWFVLLSVTYQ